MCTGSWPTLPGNPGETASGALRAGGGGAIGWGVRAGRAGATARTFAAAAAAADAEAAATRSAIGWGRTAAAFALEATVWRWAAFASLAKP